MKLFWLVAIVLAAPVVPALLVDAQWDQRLAEAAAVDESRGQLAAAAMIGGLLAADIFLPVPSGPLATLAGAQLGFTSAVAVVWLGLICGAIVGFAVARRWGRPVAQRFAGDESLKQLDRAFRGRTASMLLVTRPLPILAEAAVLLSGIAGVGWKSFLPPVAAGSLLFAIGLAAVGRLAADNDMLAIAIGLSGVLPILATLGLRRFFKTRQQAARESKMHI